MSIHYNINKPIPTRCIDDLKAVFSTNDWPEAEDPRYALYGLRKADFLITAYDDHKLVGFVRASGDNLWCANIDAMCIHKDYQRRGIGSTMLIKLLGELETCQYINVSPNHPSTIPFYEKFGFMKIEEGSLLQIIH